MLRHFYKRNNAMKFSANLGFLFSEGKSNLIERYQRAIASGFKAVEHPFPTDVDQNDLLEIKKLSKIELPLVNIELDSAAPYGCASINREAFREHLARTIIFAKAFDCKKIHLMSGKVDQTSENNHKTIFLENLSYAAKALETEGLIGVIEPINNSSVPGYFLHDYSFAIDAIKTVGSPNIKLLVDIFHLQMIRGNVVNNLKEWFNYIGHIQIAQCPSRNEPDSPGELNLKYVLDEIQKLGYDDFVGCEYNPSGTTNEGLNWVKKFGYEL